jgi:Domain of unknown function (DUF4114)
MPLTDLSSPLLSEQSLNIDFPTSSGSLLSSSSLDLSRLYGATGVFTVGSSGQINVDYRFDGGAYQSQLGIFSLSGLAELDPTAPEFWQVAVQRVLSGSTFGHLLIDDHLEAARLSGALPGEGNFNTGVYRGVRTVEMAAGDRVAFILLPHGTFADALTTGDFGGQRPFFSVAPPGMNLDSRASQLAQLDTQEDGYLFTWEDLQLEGSSDHDYNDLIFHINGITGSAPFVDAFINPQREWRTTALGDQLLNPEPFDIDLVFEDGFSDSQQAIIESATRSVELMILQGLPDGVVDGQWVDDLRIQLSIQDLDGAGGTLARSRVDVLRTDGTALPLQSITQFDRVDIAHLEQSGRLFNVMQHELLSAMGFGTLWEQNGLVANNGTAQARMFSVYQAPMSR